MESFRNAKSPERKAKIDALLAQVSRSELDLAAQVLDCVVRGRYFNFERMEKDHPRALELAYLHLGND